mgnify:CR=1 FL=1
MSDSPHYVDKAVRLFTFLAKAQLLRQTPVSDIDAYRRDGAVHWLGDLPVAETVRWGTEPGQAWDQGQMPQAGERGVQIVAPRSITACA